MKKILGILIFILLLISVRYLENIIFYDPFLMFFKNSSIQKIFPEIDYLKFMASLIFRYSLNVIFSLGIIYFWFGNKKYVKYSLVLFLILFLILYPLYIYQVYNEFSWGKLIVFYIRRFLIQPIILLFLIPSFYYIKSQKNI